MASESAPASTRSHKLAAHSTPVDVAWCQPACTHYEGLSLGYIRAKVMGCILLSHRGRTGDLSRERDGNHRRPVTMNPAISVAVSPSGYRIILSARLPARSRRWPLCSLNSNDRSSSSASTFDAEVQKPSKIESHEPGFPSAAGSVPVQLTPERFL